MEKENERHGGGAMRYHCKHCGKTVKRKSVKRWVKSYCTTVDKTVHLMRVER